jgi:acyl carrier protein
MHHHLIADKIIKILSERIQIEVASHEEDFVESGLLDSLGLVELMASLEETFEIHIPFDEIEIDNFRSVNRICEFVISRNSITEPVFV